jgi:predicted dehydrogenase
VFRSGDQDYPVYHHKDVRRVIANGVAWVHSFSPTEPIRLIQIGAGAMGRVWINAIEQSTDVQLVGLVDLNLATAQRAAEKSGFPAVATATTLDHVLERVQADAVVNVTVPEAHAEISTTALLNGMSVLCEKPAADTTSAALSMVAAAEVSNRLLMVSQSRRYWRNLEPLRRQVAQLGPLGIVECSFFRGPRFGGFRDEMPYPLLADMAIHHFDLARDMIGSDPVWITSESFNPGWSWYAGDAAAQVCAAFADGIRFGYTGSWCSPGLETSWNGSWRFSGEAGTAIWDGDNQPVARTVDGATIPGVPGTGPEEIAGALAEFVNAIRNGGVPHGEIHRNVMSVAMVEAAIRSARIGRRVNLADLLDEAYRHALATEQRPQLRAALAAWPSVHEVVGRVRR